MPIRVPELLPAIEELRQEHIFVMGSDRAESQDIRPLEILVVNLMPRKAVTETQLLRVLSNTPLQLHVTFLYTKTYESTHTEQAYLESFYKTFDDIKDKKFDGLIITGAPVEQMDFEDVAYWEELSQIMEWAKKHVFSTIYICWAAQAGLYYHYGVRKRGLDRKMFGIFDCTLNDPLNPLTRGLDDVFRMPHSRHTGVDDGAVREHPELTVLAESEDAGICVAASKDGKHIFITGHPEYDVDTLRFEYERDVSQGLPIDVPVHYFPKDDPSKQPLLTWKSTGTIIYSNWLNYFVYQETPYQLMDINEI